MYSQEYQQFSASLNELQAQVISGNTQLAISQAKVANTVFRAVEAKMKLIGASINDPNIASTIDAACQKFQDLLFEIIKLTKTALTENNAANLTALASKNVQACTHMLNLEIIRRNYETSLPPPANDANAERRKYLEEQEASFQAEKMAAHKKAREEAETKQKEENANRQKIIKEKEDRAREEQEKRAREEHLRKTREEQEVRANQERMRVARQIALEKEQADRAARATQQAAEAQRKAQEAARENDDIRMELQRAEEEVARRIQMERMRIDAQERGAHDAQAQERARVLRENTAKHAEAERVRKAQTEKERAEAERKASEERLRQMNELHDRKAREEEVRKRREEALTNEKDKEREAKAKIEKAARDEQERKKAEEDAKRKKAEDDRVREEREKLAAESKKKRDEREEEERIKKEEREKELKMAHERRLAAKKELADRKEKEDAVKRMQVVIPNGETPNKEIDGSVSPRSRALSAGRERREKEMDKEVDGSVSPRSRALSAGTGDKWAQMIAKKQEDEFKEDRERIRGRRGGGQKFVDEQIRTLIRIIKSLDKDGKELGTCTFGALFAATSDTMPALAATLLQAKKRNIVDFEGDMLMQGVHDNVRITVLTTEVKDTKIYRSGSFDAAEIKEYIKKQEGNSGPANCIICAKQVYPTEKVVANNQIMHKSCFRCVQCNTVLKLAAYAYGNGKFYCEPHFQQNYSANGYNF